MVWSIRILRREKGFLNKGSKKVDEVRFYVYRSGPVSVNKVDPGCPYFSFGTPDPTEFRKMRLER